MAMPVAHRCRAGEHGGLHPGQAHKHAHRVAYSHARVLACRIGPAQRRRENHVPTSLPIALPRMGAELEAPSMRPAERGKLIDCLRGPDSGARATAGR